MSKAAVMDTPVARTASGEPPLGPAGRSFVAHQGELIVHDNERYASAARIGLLQLDSGEWILLKGKVFPLDAVRYDTREEAIESACGALMALARLYMATRPGE